MLREVNVAQKDPGLRTRWFCDDALDVMLWFDRSGTLVVLHMAERDGPRPRALMWDRADGLSAKRVEPGEETVWANRSPLLMDMPAAEAAAALTPQARDAWRAAFDARATRVPLTVRAQVHRVLRDI